MWLAIDFDGTVVEHEYPRIGKDVGAIPWLLKFREAGARLLLWTMRSDETLAEAVAYCEKHGLTFDAVNLHPHQWTWTASPKPYSQMYIDDAAFGCPLKDSVRMGGRPYVDWAVVGPAVYDRILQRK